MILLASDRERMRFGAGTVPASATPARIRPSDDNESLMTHSLASTLMLLGVVHGVVMALGLLLIVRNRNGLHWLALAILAFSLSLLRLWMLTVGLWWDLDFRRVPLAFDLAIMPLFYLFALSFTGAAARTLLRASLWLLPWLLFLLYSASVYFAAFPLASFEAKDALAARWHFSDVKAVEDYLTILIGTYLGVMILIRISRYQHRIARWIPEHQAARIEHLKWMMVILLMSMGVSIIHFLSNYFVNPEGNTISHASYVFYSIVIYAVGFIGFRLSDVPQFPDEDQTEIKLAKVSHSDLNPAFAKLESLMQDKELFTNPNLNLGDLARRLGMSNQRTSHLIKQSARTNFRSYVNSYRIDYVKRKLKDADYRDCSILAIALESGFNSEPSFYRVFKDRVGMSPTAFRQSTKNAT